jgi:hypothetical protein
MGSALTNYYAIDPGGTSGIAIAQLNPSSPPQHITDFDFTTTELGPENHHKSLYDFLVLEHTVSDSPMVVICESFDFRQNLEKSKVNLISREYIGIIRLFAEQYDVPVIFQTPSSALNFITNEKLEIMGIIRKPLFPCRHQNDSLRHLIRYFVVVLKVRDPLTALWRRENKVR